MKTMPKMIIKQQIAGSSPSFSAQIPKARIIAPGKRSTMDIQRTCTSNITEQSLRDGLTTIRQVIPTKKPYGIIEENVAPLRLTEIVGFFIS